MVMLSTSDLLPFTEATGDDVFYTGATRPLIYGQFQDAGGALPLYGASVTITIDPIGTSAAGIYGAPAVIVDPANGIVSYALLQPFSLPPTVREATFAVQFTADFGNNVKMIADPFTIRVVQAIGYGV